MIILFTSALDDLTRRFGQLSEMLDTAGGLWVAWPKKASKLASELTFDLVQRLGLDSGLVDNKSCTIDQDWQGLRFVYRKKDRLPFADPAT